MRQHKTKEIAREKQGFDLAVRAGEKMIRFFQNNGSAALRALVVDQEPEGLNHGRTLFLNLRRVAGESAAHGPRGTVQGESSSSRPWGFPWAF
jgi:hypothetical protein